MEYVEWDHEGKHYRQITPLEKRRILAQYAEKYNLRTFIETGTCDGGTSLFMLDYADAIYTVEKDYEVYIRAYFNLNHEEIHHFLGDSVELLPVLLKGKDKALFWLDAHEEWAGPVVQELNIIFASEITGAILVDDMDYISDILPDHPNWARSEEYGIVRFVHEKTKQATS